MPQSGDKQLDQERDRIMLIGLLRMQEIYNKCKEEGKEFDFTNMQIATALGRSKRWVLKHKSEISKENSNVNDIIKTKPRSGKPSKFTPRQIKSVTFDSANKRRRSVRKTAKRFNRNIHNAVTMSKSYVHELRQKSGLKPFHRINAPMISKLNREDRIKLATYFIDEFELGILQPHHIIFVDEFFIYVLRKINTKNDIIWALNPNDIPEYLRYNRHPRNPQCVGIMIAIAWFGVWYDIKDVGQSWNGEYFRDDVIPSITQWKDENADDPDMCVLQHDCCPGWRAYATQDLLRETWGINKFIPNAKNYDGEIPKWPGNSPDMNPVENFGSILMDMTEAAIDRSRTVVGKEKLINIVEKVVREAAADPTLVDDLIMSFPKRCNDIIAKNGGPLKY